MPYGIEDVEFYQRQEWAKNNWSGHTTQDVYPSNEATTTTTVTTVTKEKWVDGKLVEKTVDKTEKTTTTGRKQPRVLYYVQYK